MLESMFRSAFPHARSPKAARAHARSRKAFDYMAISGLLSNRIRDHPAMASQIRMPYVPGFHQTLPLLSLRPVLHRLRDMPGAQPFRASRSAIVRATRSVGAARGPSRAGGAWLAAAAPARSRPARNDGPAPRRPRPRWACPDVPIAAHGRPGPLAHRRRGLPGGPSRSSGATGGKRRCRSMRSSKAGDAARVARHLVGRAGAGPRRMSAPPAGARIHGRDQLEAGRKPRRAHGPRDQHPAGFQRLAQRFQRASVEFGQ